MKKLEKKTSEASKKGLGDEDSDKESNHDEYSNDIRVPTRCSVLGLMFAKQIQSLIANVVKSQLGEGNRKVNLYIEPYTKRINLLHMPHGYQPLKLNQFRLKGQP